MSEKKVVKIAAIGAGSRPRGLLELLLKHDIQVISVFDPDKAVAVESAALWSPEGTAKVCDSYQEAIDLPGVEWVFVASPNSVHCEQVVYAFQAGKHVFSEKPLATTIGDCKKIYDAHQKSGKLFATGFVLRYSAFYRKIKELLDSGKLGEIISIEANENIPPNHGGYIMTNWRRHSSLSGPHILEKCCHDLDLINWFCQSLPSRVFAFAGRRFFIPENRKMEEKYPNAFKGWWDPHAAETPFTDDTDMDDYLSGVAEFRNKVTVSFNCTMCNAIPERRMRFNCAEGTLCADLYSKQLVYRTINEECSVLLDFKYIDGHGGGDAHIMEELAESMHNETVPKCSGSEGLESAVYALALDQAAKTGSVVDLEETWKSLGR